MARKTIFDILANKWDLSVEISRVHDLFVKEHLLQVDRLSYTLRKFVDIYCFEYWKSRGRCIDVNDLMRTINYEKLLDDSEKNFDSLWSLIEIVFTFWKLAETKINNSKDIKYYTNFYHLSDVLQEILSHYNHKALYDEEAEQIIVIENKPEITAVVETVEPKLSLEVIRYNHYTLRGDIDAKRSILNFMGQALEPRRKELSKIHSGLEDNIFYFLNNLHIRHNNKARKDKNYKEYVAKMTKKKLELWYDELYQMILLAFLELEHVQRSARCKDLRLKIEKPVKVEENP